MHLWFMVCVHFWPYRAPSLVLTAPSINHGVQRGPPWTPLLAIVTSDSADTVA